jgi:hypothetical protein
MMLLRRAPREVYRVYGEDEFFAYTGGEERFEVGVPRIGERRLHRLAGVTMLLAATGAVGGLIAIASLSSVGDGRRVRVGLLAAAASLLPSRAARGQVWRERPGLHGLDDRSVRDRWARRRTAQDRPAARVRPVRPAGVHPAGVHPAGVHPAGVHPAGVRPEATVVAEGTPTASAARDAGASAEPQPSGQSQFGFER